MNNRISTVIFFFTCFMVLAAFPWPVFQIHHTVWSCWSWMSYLLRSFDVTDDTIAASRTSRHLHPLHVPALPKLSATSATSAQSFGRPPPSASPTPAAATTPSSPGTPTASAPTSKLPVIHFKALFCGLAIGASLLPSLRAQYKVCCTHATYEYSGHLHPDLLLQCVRDFTSVGFRFGLLDSQTSSPMNSVS